MARYYDEALAHAARIYVSTRDERWEQRYRQIKAESDRLISDITREGKKDIRFAVEVNTTQHALERMEDEALELARGGKVEEAVALLQSERYLERRDTQERALENYARRIHAAHDGALADATRAVEAATNRMRDLVESSGRLVSISVIVALVLALVSGFLIARSISIPLGALSAAADEIGRGKLDVYIPAGSDDEISQLAVSFKKMAQDVKRTTTSVDNLAREINERKKAEENTRKACRELEEANRELKHVQSQLVQTERLAGIGQLAAGVAHEVNTPIGYVSCNFETLEKYVTRIREFMAMYDDLVAEIAGPDMTESGTKAQHVAQSRESMRIDSILEDLSGLFYDCREGLERVTDIVRTLRDFARIDQIGSIDEFNINDGIRSTLAVARNELKWDVEVESELGQVPPIVCNPGQINQVLLNLILNAAQAIKSQERSEKGRIRIRTYAAEDHVVCEISDNGPGIEPEYLSQIFDPFFTTKPVGEGTGLGLSVSHDIVVTKHKGELFVESAMGKGTIFTIKLPCDKIKVACGREVRR
jgi:signal transduction histidine kinase